MVTKINDLIRYGGEITTLDKLDREGLIEYREAKNFFGGKKVRTAYFADIKGTSEGWEIGKTAYQSRTHAPITIKEVNK